MSKRRSCIRWAYLGLALLGTLVAAGVWRLSRRSTVRALPFVRLLVPSVFTGQISWAADGLGTVETYRLGPSHLAPGHLCEVAVSDVRTSGSIEVGTCCDLVRPRFNRDGSGIVLMPATDGEVGDRIVLRDASGSGGERILYQARSGAQIMGAALSPCTLR